MNRVMLRDRFVRNVLKVLAYGLDPRDAVDYTRDVEVRLEEAFDAGEGEITMMDFSAMVNGEAHGDVIRRYPLLADVLAERPRRRYRGVDRERLMREIMASISASVQIHARAQHAVDRGPAWIAIADDARGAEVITQRWIDDLVRNAITGIMEIVDPE